MDKKDNENGNEEGNENGIEKGNEERNGDGNEKNNEKGNKSKIFEDQANVINQKLRALQKCCKDPEQKVCDETWSLRLSKVFSDFFAVFIYLQ